MVTGTARMTVEEFDEWVMRPENADKRLEYIGGEAVEVVSNNYSSEIAFNIGFYIKLFLRENGLEGRITGADGGYQIANERYIPDIAYTTKARQPDPSHDAYNPTVPDLVVEVLSPSNEPDEIRIKIANYLSAGVIAWVVNPDTKTVEVYTPGQKAYKLSAEDTLDGGEVLPGFALAVKAVFPD